MKPSVEYLDTLNGYRKRSRSREDEGYGSASKLPRMNGDALNGFPPSETPLENGVAEEASLPATDDPIVYGTSLPGMRRLHFKLTYFSVNGEPVPFSQVTEEHQDLMTPEEYTAYYEVMTSLS